MFEITWTDAAGTEHVLDFDVAVSEGYSSPATVSDHAVEDGASISDTVISGNDTITIEGLTTNTPVRAMQFGMDGAQLSERSVPIKVAGRDLSVKVQQASQKFDRVKTVDAQIRTLLTSGQRLTLRTALRDVSPVVIQTYDVQRDATTGTDSLPVTLTFRKIRTVTTQRVTPTRTGTRAHQATQNRGNQPATQTSDTNTNDQQSLAYGLRNYIQQNGFGL